MLISILLSCSDGGLDTDSVAPVEDSAPACPAGAAWLGGTLYPTLPEAVAAAGEGATIQLCPGSARVNLVIERALTIEGDVDGTSALQGGRAGSVVVVSGGDLVLRGLTVRGGSGTLLSSDGTHGGGIWVEAKGSLALDGVTVTDNYADQGGGIALKSGTTLTLSNSVIEANAATDLGGGVHVAGTMEITGSCTFQDNRAAFGGAVFLESDGGELHGLGSVVQDNYASTSGGGFYVDGVRGASLVAWELRDNSADYGGALYVESALETAELLAEDNYGYLGGAIYFASTAAVTLGEGTELRNNLASYGGALFLGTQGSGGGSLWVDPEAVVADNVAYTGGGGFASGVTDSYAAAVTVTGLTLSGGESKRGGGVYVDGGPIVFEELVVRDAVASVEGGGLFVAPTSELRFEGGEVVDNRAPSGAGFAVQAAEGEPALVSDGLKIEGNDAGHLGGGMWISGDSGYPVSVSGFTMSANRAGSGGGALAMEEVTLSLVSPTFSGEVADGGFGDSAGGAVWVGSGSIEVLGGSLSGGGVARGGALAVEEGSAVLDSVRIHESKAAFGGGLWVGAGSLQVLGGTVESNDATWGGAAAVTEGGTLLLQGVGVSGNAADVAGAVFLQEGSLAFQDASFSSNGEENLVIWNGEAYTLDGEWDGACSSFSGACE